MPPARSYDRATILWQRLCLLGRHPLLAERLLLRKIGEYHEAKEVAMRELLPHHICNYLYELAQEFNRLYEKSLVIGDEREAIRIELVRLYRETLAAGLNVLGIAAPERV